MDKTLKINMLEVIQHPWHWALAGTLIGCYFREKLPH